jgi:hypothetical protein
MPHDKNDDELAETLGYRAMPSFIGNLIGYGLTWVLGAVLWSHTLGYTLWLGALAGLTIAAAGAAFIAFTTPSAYQRAIRTGNKNWLGGSGTLSVLSGLVALFFWK